MNNLIGYRLESGEIKSIIGEFGEGSQQISETRLNICRKCENVSQEPLRCKLCGCGLSYKTKLIYPLDENNKAFFRILKDRYKYVCPLKKW